MQKEGEDDPEKKAAFEKAFDLAVQKHKELSEELEQNIDYQVVPIKKLVAIQLECGLLMAEYLKNR